VRTLTPAEVRAGRQRSLLLTEHAHRTPAEVVTWFGAMQAQDLASALWSLGLRLPGSTQSDMLEALAQGGILRTWPMRGTIHLVPSEDAAWMVGLMGAKALASARRRQEQLGLTPQDVARATTALADALGGARMLTRGQALGVINEAGITTEGQRGYHLLLSAAQVGVISIGPQVEDQQTFMLLADAAPHPRHLDPREAAAELAFRYFRSHGPTTVQDFAGWTGLGLRVSRQAVDDNEGRLAPAVADGATVWLAADGNEDEPPARTPGRTWVLPGFDEFMLGYKDRSLHVPDGRFDTVVPGGNGVFRATVVRGGVVRATWGRTLKAASVTITVEAFEELTAAGRSSLDRAFREYGSYLGRRPDVTVTDPNP
jgi:hypothetical protein